MFRFRDDAFRVLDVFRGSGFRDAEIQSLGLRASGLGHRAWDLGFRVGLSPSRHQHSIGDQSALAGSAERDCTSTSALHVTITLTLHVPYNSIW